MTLVRAIVADDAPTALRLLATSGSLASARAGEGATRAAAVDYYLAGIEHYLYEGDTALHIAAAAYRLAIVRQLITMGADVGARNRRGAQPLHYAADGIPGRQTGTRALKLRPLPASSKRAPTRMPPTRAGSHRSTVRCAPAAQRRCTHSLTAGLTLAARTRPARPRFSSRPGRPAVGAPARPSQRSSKRRSCVCCGLPDKRWSQEVSTRPVVRIRLRLPLCERAHAKVHDAPDSV